MRSIGGRITSRGNYSSPPPGEHQKNSLLIQRPSAQPGFGDAHALSLDVRPPASALCMSASLRPPACARVHSSLERMGIPSPCPYRLTKARGCPSPRDGVDCKRRQRPIRLGRIGAREAQQSPSERSPGWAQRASGERVWAAPGRLGVLIGCRTTITRSVAGRVRSGRAWRRGPGSPGSRRGPGPRSCPSPPRGRRAPGRPPSRPRLRPPA
jgi:hypothetical protein